MPINDYIDEIEKNEECLRTSKNKLFQISGIPQNRFRKFRNPPSNYSFPQHYKNLSYDEESKNRVNFFGELI